MLWSKYRSRIWISILIRITVMLFYLVIKENVPRAPVAVVSSQILEEENALDVVLTHVGEIGRYQKLLFLLMMPFAFFFAFLYFIQLFIAATPQNHWCRIPELSHLSLEARRNLSAPGAGTKQMDKCFTYDVDWTQVAKSMTPPSPSTKKVPCKHGWDFEFSDITYKTVVTERGWVCDHASNVPMAQAVFFLGAFIGSIFFGWFADRFGRVPALVSVTFLAGVGGIVTTFTTAMWDFALVRFITGMSFDNLFYMIYILALEYVGPEQRTMVASMSVALFFGSGCFVLLGFALLVQDWRLLLWVTSVPMLFVVFAPLILPESARWLISRGRVMAAVNILRKFERINKNKIPDSAMDHFIEVSSRTRESSNSLLDLMRSTPLRLTSIFMLVVYMASSLCYDTLVRLSDAFGLSFFVTFAMMSATEIPAVTLLALILDRSGRRRLTAITMALAGIVILLAIFVPKGIGQAGLAMLARFFVNMSWNASAQWATELLPTPVRATASSVLHMSGHFISIISPYVAYSERTWAGLPLLIIGVAVLTGAAVAVLLPETKGLSMPQTMADGERIVRKYTFWGIAEKTANRNMNTEYLEVLRR